MHGSKRKIVVLFFSGKGLIARAIRWQTRSLWSHVAFLLGNKVIESHSGTGVVKRELEDADRLATRRYVECDEKTYYRLLQWCNKRVGQRYDYLAVLRFIDRRRCYRDDTWFCSELVYAGLCEVGIVALNETAPWECSPGLLARSPVLAYEEWPETPCAE